MKHLIQMFCKQEEHSLKGKCTGDQSWSNHTSQAFYPPHLWTSWVLDDISFYALSLVPLKIFASLFSRIRMHLLCSTQFQVTKLTRKEFICFQFFLIFAGNKNAIWFLLSFINAKSFGFSFVNIAGHVFWTLYFDHCEEGSPFRQF